MLEPMDRSDQPIDPGPTITHRADPGLQTPAVKPATPALSWIVMAFLTICSLVSCAAPIQYTRPIHEDSTHSVTLEARYGYGQEGAAFRFAHPLVLSEAQWHRILGRVQMVRRNWIIQVGAPGAGPSPAFRDDERTYLAGQLATAFARARPDEWVLFYLSRAAESGLIEITSGGFFVEGSRLHLVLANYRLPASMPYVATQVREDPLRPMGDTYYSLAAGEHQEVRTHHDWRWTKPLLEHPMELVSDLDADVVSPEPERLDAPGIPQRGVDQPDEPELEQRFRTLERLREHGVITEQEYQTKRRQLIEGL